LLSVVAYPAAWGDTGVMTFIISHAGKLYQRDMGKSSAAIGDDDVQPRSGMERGD